VCGGVACVPHRLRDVERAVTGSAKNAETADRVAELAAKGATPLQFNQFKITLMENLVRRAIRDA
jgi:xanthine dehydrogenase YagS FAD-binding subunit